MTTPTRRQSLALILFAALLGALGVFATPYLRSVGAADEPATPAKDDHAADRAAIRAQMAGFTKAFEQGDAERVASFWTTGGELVGDDGQTWRGRVAIARAYRALFGKKEKRHCEIEQDSLRFLSRDTAIAEGTFKVSAGKGEPTANRYSVLHVREGGKWLMAVVREGPAQAASLRDLDWLIGSWVAKTEGTEVRTRYEWLWNKSFIQARFTIHQEDRTLHGMQMIGRDPATGELRTWTFESEGSFGAAIWTREGKTWVQEAEGRLADGSTLTAMNILTPIDRDTFTWRSIQRTRDGEELADLATVKVTRVKDTK